ncbi:hypothetical protein ig2599ANME_2440 [groundwater metagenome]
MTLRDVVIFLIALVVAVVVFQFLWKATMVFFKFIIFLIVAYVLYLFLKKSM